MLEPSVFLPTLYNIDMTDIQAALADLERYSVASTGTPDAYEEKYAQRWLTQLIPRLSTLDSNAEWLAQASALLARLCGSSAEPARKAIYGFDLADADGILSPVELSLRTETLVGDSTGAKIWPAGSYLARCIMSDPDRFNWDNQKNALQILELGSGTGVVGIAIAASMRARSLKGNIVLSDNDEFALANLKQNLDDNLHLFYRAQVLVQRIEWRDILDLTEEEKSDLIFGGDLVYSVHHAALLRHVITQRLKRRGIAYIMISLRPTHSQELANVDLAFDAACPLRLTRHPLEEVADEPYSYQLLDIRWR